ncbi:MAG: AmmeMemoRadiSam system protein B [Thermodesulfovibrionales bacterium]|nr:AmmeMemoRadiSam system protein B [Thermodesulfovibrionales bacterium]
MLRSPAVAGQFYPDSPSRLNSMVEQMMPALTPKRVIAAISPHAGLMYSGYVAGALYSKIILPNIFFLLGPNHTGLGSIASIMTEGEWTIPTGRFRINSDIAREIIRRSDLVSADVKAHLFEHSLEVQLPFIAYRAHQEGRELPEIVPVVLGPLNLEECRAFGEVLGDLISELKLDAVIIASSDMSHYVSDTVARQKDKKAIQKILALDAEGLYHTVKEERISMCGYIPATCTLFASRRLGAREAELIKYMTSGEISGDYDQVVGYAGILIW